MIRKVIVTGIFLDLFIALGIAMVMISTNQPIHPVDIGVPFLSFMNQCSRELKDIAIEIPTINYLDFLEIQDGWEFVINFLISIYNGLLGVLNFIILVVNTILQLLEFCFIIIKNLMVLKDDATSRPLTENPISPFGVGGFVGAI